MNEMLDGRDDFLNQPIDEPFFEMATITRDRDNGILISVNPEREHLNIAYFKVYDSDSVNKAKRVARLHFKDSGMEYHKRDRNGKLTWDIKKDTIKEVLRILREESADAPGYTNWQYACYRWNYENDLIDAGYQKYFAGDYDEKYKNAMDTNLQEAYVPSTQEMPKTWKYDPPKGK